MWRWDLILMDLLRNYTLYINYTFDSWFSSLNSNDASSHHLFGSRTSSDHLFCSGRNGATSNDHLSFRVSDHLFGGGVAHHHLFTGKYIATLIFFHFWLLLVLLTCYYLFGGAFLDASTSNNQLNNWPVVTCFVALFLMFPLLIITCSVDLLLPVWWNFSWCFHFRWPLVLLTCCYLFGGAILDVSTSDDHLFCSSCFYTSHHLAGPSSTWDRSKKGQGVDYSFVCSLVCLFASIHNSAELIKILRCAKASMKLCES